MLTKPRFKSHGYLKLVAPDTLFFFASNGTVHIQGQLYYQIANLIDGTRTVNDIASLLKQAFRPIEVLGALNYFQKSGLIEDAVAAAPQMPVEQINGWHSLNINPGKIAQARVAVHCIGNVDVSGFVAMLESMSIAVVGAGSEATVDVVITDDYLQPELEAFNVAAQQSRRPWLLVNPLSVPILLGPVFQPGTTACYACLRQRLQLHRQIDLLYAQETESLPPYPSAQLPAMMQAAFSMAALALGQWMTDPTQSPLVNAVRSVHPLTLEVQQHSLVRRAQCPVCGDASQHEPQPIVVHSNRKVDGNDGGFRTATPAETIARYDHHISPITGIAPYLQLAPNKGIAYTYVTGAPLSRRLLDWNRTRSFRQSAASGKGITEIQAKVSGLCEALERYSGIFEGNEPRIEALYGDLGDKALHPAKLLNFSERQYDEREIINQSAHNLKRLIPVRFDESRPIEWTPVWSMTNSDWKYIPTAYGYYNYPQIQDYVFCQGDSNGNAAGSALEDAIFQGFLELVERDAAAMWWFNKIQHPGVDLSGVNDRYIEQLQTYYQSIKREFWVLDLTNDLNIPVFCALTRRIEGEYEVLSTGFGAHLDPKIALMRALSEMNQLLDPAKTLLMPEDAQTMAGSSIDALPFLRPDPLRPSRKISDYPYSASDDLLDDLNLCLEAVHKQGLEMLVLDQTRPDIGLSVVKVIVPGLRHFWPRLGPGRLYDVPVKLGWINAPLQEHQLNSLMLSG